MVNRDSEIVSKILSMSDDEMSSFMSELKPETLDYLDNLLQKASTGFSTSRLKRYLESNI
jgi:hypothetical protein